MKRRGLRISEDAWTAQVLALAAVHGWRRAHFRPARVLDRRTGAETWRTPVQGDGAGFPDLILARGSRLIAAELKADDAPAGLPVEQAKWLHAFDAAGAETYVWRPRDLDRVSAALAPKWPG